MSGAVDGANSGVFLEVDPVAEETAGGLSVQGARFVLQSGLGRDDADAARTASLGECHPATSHAFQYVQDRIDVRALGGRGENCSY